MIEILKVIEALATIATALYFVAAPLKVRGFTGLELPGGRGITEVRAVLGDFLSRWALRRSFSAQRICT